MSAGGRWLVIPELQTLSCQHTWAVGVPVNKICPATVPPVIPHSICVHAIHSPPLLSCSQLVMVTEPVFASVANVLSGFDGIPSVQSVRLSELEVKHGITQV